MKDKKITIAIQKKGRLSDNSKNLLEMFFMMPVFNVDLDYLKQRNIN
jgi:hypothetical protein